MLVVFLLIWQQDFKNPFYVSRRVGRDQQMFGMLKFRTMVYDAEKTGVFSTSNGDSRITKLGHFLRRTKLDEIPQLINVVLGQMSFVGPRANVISEVDYYSEEEMICYLSGPALLISPRSSLPTKAASFPVRMTRTGLSSPDLARQICPWPVLCGEWRNCYGYKADPPDFICFSTTRCGLAKAVRDPRAKGLHA